MSQTIVESSVESKPHKTSPPKRTSHRRRVLIVLAVVIGVGLAVGIPYFIDASHYESTDDAFIEGHVIALSPQVSARVVAVHVLDNQFVHRGDPLVELDPTDYQVAFDQSRGAEASANGKLQQAISEVASATASRDEAQAELQVAQANFDNADQDLKRFEGLDERARSKQAYDNAIAAQKTTLAQVAQAKAQVASAETRIATAQAAVLSAQGDLKKATADVSKAEVDLTYCRMVAPEDGRVTRKSVEIGSYVQTGQDLMALVPKDVWVVANFKETQLDAMRPGEPVTISVDAYPEHAFTGKVESIQAGTGSRFSMLPAENATGNFVKVVQRVPVKIVFDPGQMDDDHLLAPGMSVEPKVRVR